MSKKITDKLKAQVKESGYTNLKPTESSIDRTYTDLDIDFNCEYEFTHDLIINGKVITNDFVKNLYSEYKNLIPKDKDEKGDYRLFRECSKKCVKPHF